MDPVAYTQDGVPIPDDQLAEAVAAKQARFPKGVPVTMQMPSGEVQQVDSQHAWTHIQQGARPLTAAELEQRAADTKSQQSYSDSALAVGHGAINTLGLGLPDVVGAELSPEYKAKVQQLERNHPFEEGVGRVGALAVPIAGEMGLGGSAVKALGAPLRGLSSVARGTGEAVGSLVAPGAARAVVSGATTMGIEGAGFATGESLANQAIHDEPLTADRILFSAGLSAAFGGGLGLVSHGIGRLAGKVEPPAKPSLLSPAEAPTVNPGMEATAAAAPTSTLGQRFQGAANDVALAQTIKGATGAVGSDISRLTRLGGKDILGRLAGRIQNELPLSPGATLGDAVDAFAMMKRATGEQMGAAVRTLDEQGVRIDNRALLDAVREDVLNPLRSSELPINRALAKRVDSEFLSDIDAKIVGGMKEFQRAERIAMVNETRAASKAMRDQFIAQGMSNPEAWAAARQNLTAMAPQLQQRARLVAETQLGSPETIASSSVDNAIKLRREFDKFLEGKRDLPRGKLTRKEQIVLDMRNSLEKNIREQIAQKANPQAAQQWAELNSAYRDWSLLAPIAKSRYGAKLGNRGLSITDNMHAVGSALAGTMVAGPAGVLAAVPALAINHLGKSVQASRAIGKFATKLAGEMSTIPKGDLAAKAASASGHVAESVTKTLQKGEVSLSTSKKTLAQQIPVAVGRAAMSVADVAAHLQDTSPEMNAQRANTLANLGDTPGLQRHIGMAQTAARQVLLEEMPKPDQPHNPALGVHQPAPSEALMREYADIIAIVNKPELVLDHYNHGRLTRKHVEVLSRTVPMGLQEAQAHAMKAFSQQLQTGKTPSYQTRLQTGILLGAPVDSTDTPQYTDTVQNFYQSTAAHIQPRGGGGRRSRASSDGLADRRMTSSERIDRA